MRSLFALVLTTVLLAGGAAQAQATGAILVLDENQVFTQSVAGASALSQLKTIGEQIAKELDTERKALTAERDAIARQRATLTQDQLKVRLGALDKRAQAFERLAESRGREMEATRDNALKILNTNLQPVLEEVVRAKGALILLNTDHVIYSAKSLDVTAEVTAKLNARLKPFGVQRIKPAAPAAAPAAAR